MEEENHQEEIITEQQEIQQAKPKKELSQRQKEHLENIRVKALERKREIKLMKNKQYEEKVSKLKVEQIEIKEPPKQEEVKKEVEIKKDEPKKKKLIKKITRYVEAADSNDEEEEEEIIVKPKKKVIEPPLIQPVPKELSYNELLYQTSLEKMQNRIMNERAQQLIHNVIPNYY